jgi:5-hydroxyisourate hydrolase-like protein (transthyretin family)
MKKIILFLILGCAFTAQGQYGNNQRNGQRGGQRQQRQQMSQTPQKAPKPKFEVEKFLGIIVYDINKAAKKSSIKLSSKVGKEFSKVLTKFNKDIKGITRINSFSLRETKEMVESFQKKAMDTGDYSNQRNVQKKMNERLKPIAVTLRVEDRKLDKIMKVLLSEKQYKKWIKYNKKKHKIFPKEEEKKEE